MPLGDLTAPSTVVRKHEVGRHVRAQRRRVQGDVAVTFGAREVLQQLCFDALVAIEHEDR
jgi:hypothetical protein